MSEKPPGFEEYTPSRLEWLVVILNSYVHYTYYSLDNFPAERGTRPLRGTLERRGWVSQSVRKCPFFYPFWECAELIEK